MRMNLQTKILVTVAGVVVLAVASGLVGVFAVYRTGRALDKVLLRNVAGIRASEQLQIALLEQSGLLSAYLMSDGEQSWLEKLDDRKPAFEQWLSRTRENALGDSEINLLRHLETIYRNYDGQRSQAVTFFDSGQRQTAVSQFLKQVKPLYEEAYEVAEQLTAIHQQSIDDARSVARNEIRRMSLFTTVCAILVVLFGLGLLWLVLYGIVLPLRKMATEVRAFAGDGAAGELPSDELRAVGSHLKLLMSNVSAARSSLEESRGRLAMAENLASLGKLAACVAHEIRNPLTAVKMWLFSIRKAVGCSAEVDHQFDIVSDEIARLENVVHHFLEFARPPEIKLSVQDVTGIVEKSLELLRHRIDAAEVALSFECDRDLPAVTVDAEQFKQVLVNLINNAVQALEESGEITITAVRDKFEDRDMVVIRVTDTGSGMPVDVQERVFEPFFTTKEMGSGLGLSIAARIMARHGGRLTLESSGELGTTFAVWIPVAQVRGASQIPGRRPI